MGRSSFDSKPITSDNGGGEPVEWEVRPGGMLVQKRDDAAGTEADTGGPMIRIRVSHGSSTHQVSLPAQSTFGDLKRVLAAETGLEPRDQRLLFRGRQREEEEFLHMAGVKDRAKVMLMEDPASRERRLEISRACEGVDLVRVEVDKLAEKVSALELNVMAGRKVAEKEFAVLTELLMRELLKLDGIEAEGEARVKRKNEVRRIQNFVDTLDTLKTRNSNPLSSTSKSVSVTTEWETFDSGVGSLNAPPPRVSSTTKTNDWESFD